MRDPAREPIDVHAGVELPKPCVKVTNSSRQGECEDIPSAWSQFRSRLFAVEPSFTRMEHGFPPR
jgi:hypothetical protein